MSLYKKILGAAAVAGLSLLAVPTVFAAALTYSVDTNVTIGSNNYVIVAGSAATSVVVGTSTLTVTIPASTTFTLKSPDKYKLTNDQALTQDCLTSYNQATATGPLTVVFTPEATACTAQTVGSGGGGGLGGGGGSPAPTPNPTPNPNPNPGTPHGRDLSSGYGLYHGTLYDKATCHAFGSPAEFFAAVGETGFAGLTFDTSFVPNCGSPAPAPSGSLSSMLSVGMTKGPGVLALQQYLNSHGFVVAKKGAGSPGHETTILGGLTKNALKKWQNSVGLKATGKIDQATINYLVSIGL